MVVMVFIWYLCIISANHHWSCEFVSCSRQGVLDTTLCDKGCQWLATGWWFSPGTPVSYTNKTDCHDITEILLKVALNTITYRSLLGNKFQYNWHKICSIADYDRLTSYIQNHKTQNCILPNCKRFSIIFLLVDKQIVITAIQEKHLIVKYLFVHVP